MITATAKYLRQETAPPLDALRSGQVALITYRKKSIAVLAPVEKTERKGLNPIGFGMWQDRKEVGSVEKWLKNLRKPRYKR